MNIVPSIHPPPKSAASALAGEPVVLTDTQWTELVAAVEAGVHRWSTALAHWHQAGKQRIERHSSSDGGFDYLGTVLTESRRNNWHPWRSAGWLIVRECSTGRIARMKGMKDGHKSGALGRDIDGAMAPIPNPKRWRGLERKPINKIMRELQLLDFTVHVDRTLTFATLQEDLVSAGVEAE